MHNNFDQSSTGINIEAQTFYDEYLARHTLVECFESLSSTRNRTSLAYYIDYGNVKGHDSIKWTIQGTVKELRRFLKGNDSYDNINKMRKAELIECAMESLSDIINDFQSAIKWHESDSLSIANNFMHIGDYNLQLIPNKTLSYMNIIGYSQGDHCKVYYSPSDLMDCWGSDFINESDLQKTFENLFYDQPIYSTVTINGTEYAYYDCPAYDEYDFKRDEFIQYVSKESGVAPELIDQVLPKEPEYY